MDVWVAWLQEAGKALSAVPALPFLGLGVVVTLWHIARTVEWQRRTLRMRMHRPAALVLWRLLGGLLAGLAVSAAGLGLGFALDARVLVLFWIALTLLALIRTRLARPGMAAGVLALGHLALSALPVPRPDEGAAFLAWWTWLVDAWTGLDAMGLLLLAGLLHLAEGLLLLAERARFANPLVLASKRGKRIGAWELTAVWPVPLLLLVPGDTALPWVPLFGADAGTGGWSFLLFPVLAGTGARTVAFWPEDKARFTARLSLLYGAVLAILAAAAAVWRDGVPALPWVAAAAAPILLELAGVWNRWREQGRRRLYVRDGRGLSILAVQPGTAAAEMGLRCGEIIRRVNGVPVSNLAEFHAALQRQPAYSRLEVLDRGGEVRYAQRARYAGERHMLGVVPAPDGSEPAAFPDRPFALWHWLTGKGLLDERKPAAGTKTADSDAAKPETAAAAADAERPGNAPEAAESTAAMAGPGEASALAKSGAGAAKPDSAAANRAAAVAESASPEAATAPSLGGRSAKRKASKKKKAAAKDDPAPTDPTSS